MIGLPPCGSRPPLPIVRRVKGSGPAIELRGVSRAFGGRTALQPLDLAVERGEIFGLLGPNGSGKTTTLRVVAALLKPSAGSVRVDSWDPALEPMQVRHAIGVMPEKPSLYDRQTVDDNLRFWAEAHRVPEVEAAIAEALDFTGMAERRRDRVGELSKGLKQRIGLARAIIHRPRILLLDEPSSGLDPSAAAAMELLIRQLVADGATVLMNTHRLAEAERLCDRVAILREGHLLELGAPAQIRARLLGNVVEITLAGLLEQPAIRAVESLPGVSDVSLQRSSFSCRLEDAARDTPELVRRLVSAGARIVAVQHAGDLEKAYLELMARPVGPGVLEEAA